MSPSLKFDDTAFLKLDRQKTPLHLLPHDAHNWRKVDKRSRYYRAALAHLFAWWRGETNDQESGLPHLAHAACCVLFLVECEAADLGADDRPASTKSSQSEHSGGKP
jgi:hypothetical protein